MTKKASLVAALVARCAPSPSRSCGFPEELRKDTPWPGCRAPRPAPSSSRIRQGSCRRCSPWPAREAQSRFRSCCRSPRSCPKPAARIGRVDAPDVSVEFLGRRAEWAGAGTAESGTASSSRLSHHQAVDIHEAARGGRVLLGQDANGQGVPSDGEAADGEFSLPGDGG